jgi:hypothetical protein
LTTDKKGADYLLALKIIQVGDRPIKFLEYMTGKKLRVFQNALEKKRVYVSELNPAIDVNVLNRIFS